MKKAWKNNKKAWEVDNQTNSHRLLLFYAVECGLKALILKRNSQRLSSDNPDIGRCGHDINKLLDYLRAGSSLKISNEIFLSPINKGKTQRKCSNRDINQIWRYGGTCSNIADEELQKSLECVNTWLEGQL